MKLKVFIIVLKKKEKFKVKKKTWSCFRRRTFIKAQIQLLMELVNWIVSKSMDMLFVPPNPIM